VCEMEAALHGPLNELASIQHDRETLLANDVRTLLGVAPAPHRDAAALRPPRRLVAATLYCHALAGLGRLLRPRAAKAQQPPAAGRPPLTADSLRRFIGRGEAAPAPRVAPARSIPDTSGQRLHDQLNQLESRRQATLQNAARYQIEMHKKFAIAAACLVFVLIGAPIALRFPRGGVGLVIGASVLIFGFYYVGLIGGETLADALIVTPFWAMWTANLVMTAIGVALFLRLNRQRVAARGGGVWGRLAALLERRAPVGGAS